MAISLQNRLCRQVKVQNKHEIEMKDILNPSKDARTISPGRRLKNFLPTVEFVIELVKNPETFKTPERIPEATFSDLFVIFLTLHKRLPQN